MTWTPPSASDFKAVFIRDFPYAPALDPNNLEFITDADITRAINDANMDFNSCLFGDSATQIFMYLAAYHLIQNIQNSTQGLNSQAKMVLTNIGVGSVSQGNQIAGAFAEDPYLAKFLKNGYGQKYLELAFPYTIGQAKVVQGVTSFA